MSNHIDMEKIKTLIMKQSCFTQFTPNEVDILASLMSEKYFSQGEVIVKEGDPVDSIYLIVKGETEVTHLVFDDQKPHVEILARLKSGDAIGLNESGFYSLSGRRTATVTAVSDVIALYLSVASFHGFTLSHSHANAVMREQSYKVLREEQKEFNE